MHSDVPQLAKQPPENFKLEDGTNVHLSKLPCGTGFLKWVWSYARPVKAGDKWQAKCTICEGNGKVQAAYACNNRSVAGIQKHLRDKHKIFGENKELLLWQA